MSDKVNDKQMADFQTNSQHPDCKTGRLKKQVGQTVEISTSKKTIGLKHVGVIFFGLWIMGVVGRICGLMPSNQYTVFDLITDVALPAGIILVIVGAIISRRKP